MPKKLPLNIEVAFANKDRYLILALQVAEETTIEQAIILSGMLSHFPEIDLAQNQVGVFGKIKTLQDIVQENDRVEIYRPLPKSAIEARFARVKAQRLMRRKKKVWDRG